MASIDVGEISVSYDESGSGDLALFIHGFPLDARMWKHQLKALGGHRRCVAVNLRGSGETTAPIPDSLSMDLHADDIAAFVAALGAERADIVALSMGGYVALALWKRNPSLVRSLVLADTQANADDDAGKAKRDAAKETVVTHGREAFALGMSVALTADGTGPAVLAAVRDMIESTDYESIVASLEGMKQRVDRTELLSSIDIPTLAIVGEEDGVTPPAVAEAMAAAIPEATLEVMGGAGHLTPMEQPERFNSLVSEFWARSDR